MSKLGDGSFLRARSNQWITPGGPGATMPPEGPLLRDIPYETLRALAHPNVLLTVGDLALAQTDAAPTQESSAEVPEPPLIRDVYSLLNGRSSL